MGLWVLCLALLGGWTDPPRGLAFEVDRITSVALDDGQGPQGVNPAGLATNRGLGLQGGIGVGEALGQWSVEANLGLLGAWNFRRLDGERRQYGWAFGMRTGPWLQLGGGVRWGRGAGPGGTDAKGVDVGLLARPSRRFSFGAAAYGALGSHAAFRAGLAMRPFKTPRVTLFSDAMRRGSESWSGWFGGEVEPVPGVVLRAAASQEGDAAFSLMFRGVQGGLGVTSDSREGSNSARIRWRLDAHHSEPLFGRSGSDVALVMVQGRIVDHGGELSLLSGDDRIGLWELQRELEHAQLDPSVAATLLHVGEFEAGLGVVQELAESIRLAIAGSKPVVAYLESPSKYGYLLAAAGDAVILPPAAALEFPGAAAAVSFYGEAFRKLGVEADFERIGRFKSAVEPYLRDEISPDFRAQLESLLVDVDEQALEELADARGILSEALATVLSEGFVPASEALSLGLVDELGYEEEAVALALDLSGRGGQTGRLVDLHRRDYRERAWRGPSDVVAVVFAAGNLVQGESGAELLTDTHLAGATTLVRALSEARRDPAVRAVVLRVDSPGGSALASDLIAREVDRLQESGRPVVASVANMAASGGYYILAGSDYVIANPASVVGSIGIYSGKFVLRDLYEKLGIRKSLVETGRNATIYSDYVGFSADQRDLLRRSNAHFYQRFLERVAEGRGLSVAEVDSLGRGRVFSGAQAVDEGLVNELGGLDLALEVAAQLAELDGSFRLRFLPRRVGLVELIRGESQRVRLLDLDYWTHAENFRLMTPLRLEAR